MRRRTALFAAVAVLLAPQAARGATLSNERIVSDMLQGFGGLALEVTEVAMQTDCACEAEGVADRAWLPGTPPDVLLAKPAHRRTVAAKLAFGADDSWRFAGGGGWTPRSWRLMLPKEVDEGASAAMSIVTETIEAATADPAVTGGSAKPVKGGTHSAKNAAGPAAPVPLPPAALLFAGALPLLLGRRALQAR